MLQVEATFRQGLIPEAIPNHALRAALQRALGAAQQLL